MWSSVSWKNPGLPLPHSLNPIFQIVPHVPRILELAPAFQMRDNVWEHVLGPWGFEVIKYPMPDVSLEQFFDEMARVALDTFLFAAVVIPLYYATAKAPQTVRRLLAFLLSSLLFLWPSFLNTGKSALINYLRPAAGFRSALLLWDIFQIRSVEEVQSWSLSRFYSQLFLMPREKKEVDELRKDPSSPYNPRLICLKNLLESFIYVFVALLLCPLFPPKEVMGLFPWHKYMIHSLFMGVALYMMLSGAGLFTLNLIGLIVGIEQLPMFMNPFFTTSIRTFWSRWNQAITGVLRRVIFSGVNEMVMAEVRKKKAKQHAQEQAKKGVPRDKTKTPVRRFIKNASLAMLTFLVSGLFHEYMLYFASPVMYGMQTCFFLINGLTAVAATFVSTYMPKTLARTPLAVRYMLMVGLYCLIAPLFFMPFQATNLFANVQLLVFHIILPRSMCKNYASFVYYAGSH